MLARELPMQDQTKKDSGRVSERQLIIRVLGGLFIGLVLIFLLKDAVREEEQAEIRARMAAYEERTEAESSEPVGVILAVGERGPDVETANPSPAIGGRYGRTVVGLR